MTNSNAALRKKKTITHVYISNRRTCEIADECYDLLVKSNNSIPHIFQRTGKLYRISWDDQNVISLEMVNESILSYSLDRLAIYISSNGRGKEHSVNVPKPVILDILARDQYPGIPPLKGVSTLPLLHQDGSLSEKEGYDSQTQYYVNAGQIFKNFKIPRHLSQESMRPILDPIRKMLAEFPFDTQASRANCVGMFLTSIIRPYINGLSPLALLDANKAGSGKSLLANINSILATGFPAKNHSFPENEEEMRKLITSILQSGDSIVTFDNLGTILRSDVFAQAITSLIWSDRLLGTNRNCNFPQNLTWILTGNNIRTGGDMLRRCYKIRIDAKSSTPQDRIFKITNLQKWVKENRKKLVKAFFAMTCAWIDAGCPHGQNPVLGGFEEWSTIIGGILEYAGIEGFLGNQQEMRENMDEDSNDWESFLLVLYAYSDGKPMSISKLAEKIKTHPEIQGQIPQSFPDLFDDTGNISQKFRSVLGKSFSKHLGTRFGSSQVYVEKSGMDNVTKAAIWQIKKGGNS
jgi:hypothetical protein